MPEVTLVAETGRPIGSRSSGRLRTAGKIPGVVYGHGVDPTPVAVDGRALRGALTSDAGLNALLNLDLGGTTHLTMARDIQRHPVRGTVTHVDFLIVRRDEVLSADVPIQITGDAKAVHNADGVVAQEMFSLTVQSTPANIPSHIEVDVTDMTVGDSIRVSDITLPNGVTTEVDPEAAIVVAQGAQVSEADLLTDDQQAEAAEAAAEDAAAEGEGEGTGDDAAEPGGGDAAGGDAAAPSTD
ncbi:MAG TPA: 50S ribosomal protein L25 [Acidimicrobiales bacterium]|nr:50S ribosomal protein L25 [Acidimicrobiales bacterium]